MLPSRRNLARERQPWTPTEIARARAAYWVLAVACLVMAGAGGYLVLLEEKPVREARPVAAVIEHMDVVKLTDARAQASNRPIVIYSYSIGDVRYTTDRLTSSGRLHDSAWVATATRQFRPGQAVTAYVGSTDPGSAFLVRDYDWRAYAVFLGPLTVAVSLAVYWPWSGLRAKSEG